MLIFSLQLITPQQQADDTLLYSQKEFAIHAEGLRAEHPTKQEDWPLQLCHSHCVTLCTAVCPFLCVSCSLCSPLPLPLLLPLVQGADCGINSVLCSGEFLCPLLLPLLAGLQWLQIHGSAFPFPDVSPALSQCSLFSPSFVSTNQMDQMMLRDPGWLISFRL